MSYVENQESIENWRFNTLGYATPMRIAVRANEEMAELLQALVTGETEKAANEAADVLIVLYGVASQLGVDLHAEVDKKMAINRARKWNLDGSGCGYHVKESK